MRYQLTVIRFPSGRFGFAGSVPVELGYEWEDKSDLKAALQCGPGLAKKRAERFGRRFCTARAWDSAEEALAEAERLGHQAVSC